MWVQVELRSTQECVGLILRWIDIIVHVPHATSITLALFKCYIHKSKYVFYLCTCLARFVEIVFVRYSKDTG